MLLLPNPTPLPLRTHLPRPMPPLLHMLLPSLMLHPHLMPLPRRILHLRPTLQPPRMLPPSHTLLLPPMLLPHRPPAMPRGLPHLLANTLNLPPLHDTQSPLTLPLLPVAMRPQASFQPPTLPLPPPTSRLLLHLAVIPLRLMVGRAPRSPNRTVPGGNYQSSPYKKYRKFRASRA